MGELQRLLAAVLFIVFAASSCGDSGQEPGDPAPHDAGVRDYAPELASTAISSVEQLPECNAAIQGRLIYVQDSMSLVACSARGWVEVHVAATVPDGGEAFRGEQGPAGERGEPGPAGEQGPAGERGPAGPPGARGTDGAAGPAGEPGMDGSSCTVVDSGNGTKTISCTDGTMVTLHDAEQDSVCPAGVLVGSFTIDNSHDARLIQDCTEVTGSLTVAGFQPSSLPKLQEVGSLTFAGGTSFPALREVHNSLSINGVTAFTADQLPQLEKVGYLRASTNETYAELLLS